MLTFEEIEGSRVHGGVNKLPDFILVFFGGAGQRETIYMCTLRKLGVFQTKGNSKLAVKSSHISQHTLSFATLIYLVLG